MGRNRYKAHWDMLPGMYYLRQRTFPYLAVGQRAAVRDLLRSISRRRGENIQSKQSPSLSFAANELKGNNQTLVRGRETLWPIQEGLHFQQNTSLSKLYHAGILNKC